MVYILSTLIFPIILFVIFGTQAAAKFIEKYIYNNNNKNDLFVYINKSLVAILIILQTGSYYITSYFKRSYYNNKGTVELI